MANRVRTNLGHVMMVPRGAYDAQTEYPVFSVVRYAGDAYVALQQSQGVTPDTPLYWQRLTEAAHAYVWVRWAEQMPQADGDMRDVPGPWIGLYSGPLDAPPEHFEAYAWQRIKGDSGDGTGDMLRAVYDADDDGLIDDAARLGGYDPDHYAADGAVLHRPPDPMPGALLALDEGGDALATGIMADSVFDSAGKVLQAVVDGGGHGSSINADRLDGYHATSFLRVENLGSAESHTISVANGEVAYAMALRTPSLYGVYMLSGNSSAVVIIPVHSAQVEATNSGRNVTFTASVAFTLQVFRTR